MTNSNFNALPPELQQRINSIITSSMPNVEQQTAPQEQPPAPAVRPSLMDHTIALRQEVEALRRELHASSQVIEAVGQAVGQLYQMFCQQTETTDYSTNYQTQQEVDSDY